MKYCVVNFGHRRSWYPDGQARLKKSFEDNGYEGDFMFFHDEHDLGCPTHQEVPYAFKAYSIMEAYKQGYERVIWCDCSIALIKPFERIVKQLDEVGYMLCNGGWTSGQWCSDAALVTLGVEREEALKMPHITAGAMAFDFTRPICVQWLERYFGHSNDGITFKGAWSNENNEVSEDPRVKGHRHDQTAASIIACQLGMDQWVNHWVYYDEQNRTDIPDEFNFTLRHGI
jgi:hypothetical protein